MTRKELIQKIAEEQELSQQQSAAVVDSIFNSIVAAVAAGDKANISGFGIFESKARAARIGRNPRTREAVPIPATIVPSFKAAKAFREKVNG